MLGAPVSFNASLARSPAGADVCATQRERATSTRTALRSGARTGDNPTSLLGWFARRTTERFGRDGWAVAHLARRATLPKARMGRRTGDGDGRRALEWSSALSAATSFNSLFAR